MFILFALLASFVSADFPSFVCSPTNDVFALLVVSYPSLPRYDTLDAALHVCPHAIFFLSDDYPNVTTSVSPAQWGSLAECGAKIYLEYPDAASLPGGGTSAAENLFFLTLLLFFFKRKMREGVPRKRKE